MSRSRLARRAVSLTAGMSLLLAGPASAHPFVRGGEAAVDSLVELELNMAHGCASEVAGEGDPTTEVALEVPDWMRIVDVPEPDGWSVTLEPDDIEVEVVTWANPDSDVPAPDFTFEAVISGEPGEERFLSVFQGCADFSYRWIGTPDEPADDPAVRLQLVAADPDRPAPPVPEPQAPDAAAEDPAAAQDDGAEAQGDRDEPAAADMDAGDADGDPLEDQEPAGSEGISTTPIIIAVIVLVLGGLAVVVVTRRRGVDA